MQIHEKLKYIRVNNGWTQSQLSKKLNIKFRQYQEMERGEAHISIENIDKISTIFTIPVTYFLQDKYFECDKRISELNHGLAKLSKNDHAELVKFAEFLTQAYKPKKKKK